MRSRDLGGSVCHETMKRKHTSNYMWHLPIRLNPLLCSYLYISSLELAGCLDGAQEGSNGGEIRGWEDIGQWMSWLPVSFYVMAITRPPRKSCGDSQPRSIFQLRVRFTNSHLNPLGFPKSSTNAESSAKCAQSCQAWPRSGGQTGRAGKRPMCGVMNGKMPGGGGVTGWAIWQTCLHLI